MRFIFTFKEKQTRLNMDRIKQDEKKHTRVSFLLPDAAGKAGAVSFSFGGAALFSLGLDGVSAFDGAGGLGGDASGFGALVSA